ncbi:MAG: leucine-rich repeat domain-containing protein [Candidatus Babeliales bacterium]|nr:leucine-rich repeat domain-containing protein [Candidatus Babeliales bacterium]
MFKLNNLVFLIWLSLISITYCAQESVVGLGVGEQEDVDGQFIFVSQENAKFSLPHNIANKSNLVEAALEKGVNAKKLKTFIPMHLLSILAKAMRMVHVDGENKKVLYEAAQKKLLTDYKLKFVFSLFVNAIKIDDELLENLFADKMVQLLLNQDGSLDISKFEELINLFDSEQNIKDWWYLIEKFYYLRSSELRPSIDTLLLNNNPKLITQLNINPANLNYIRENIIKRYKLSVNDLIDYGKNIELSADKKIDLTNFFLSGLDGLTRIPKIKVCDVLELSNNQLVDLGDNFHGLIALRGIGLINNQIVNLGDSLNGLVQLRVLILADNKIIYIGDSLHGLIAIHTLSLANNQIIDLGNSLQGLFALRVLNLSNNQIIDLGNSLHGLKALNSLFIDNNKLVDLGNSLQGLNALETLYLSNNQITDLGNSLQGLHALKKLTLNNNPLVSLGNIPERILNLKVLNSKNNRLNQVSLDLVADQRAIVAAQQEG